MPDGPAPTFGRLRLWLWLPVAGTLLAVGLGLIGGPEGFGSLLDWLTGAPVASLLGTLAVWALVRRTPLNGFRSAVCGAGAGLLALFAYPWVMGLSGYLVEHRVEPTGVTFLQGVGGVAQLGLFLVVILGWVTAPVGALTGLLAWRVHTSRTGR